MKIKLTTKKLSALPQTYTRVELIEKGVTRLVKSGALETLEIVAGKYKTINPRTFRTLVRDIIATAKIHKVSKLAFELEPSSFPKSTKYSPEWFFSTISENVILADYEFLTYKSKKPKKVLIEVLIATQSKDAQKGITRGILLAESINIARDLANTPGGDMTPSILAKKVTSLFARTSVKVTILNHQTIKKLGMGGVLGVGQGAKDKPKFIVIEYFGAGKGTKAKEKPIVLVGKGITFDTGGLQIKPGMSMYEMHMDMSGSASVVSTIHAVAKLKLKKNVIGLIPAAENGVGEDAIRPGDVLTMMSGTTVDVLHTDAEGRLVLADALHYAKKYNPKLVIDIATLTGAAVGALGQHAHAIMTKSRKFEDLFRELGEESGDYVSPLPLWPEYKQYIKGCQGDLANIAAGDTRYGGAIIAGTFLAHFAKGLPWVHIDMAPRTSSVPSDKLSRGATGEPTRLLFKVIEKFK